MSEALGYPCLGKPLLDRIGAIILGVAFLPIVVIIAIVIRVTLGSPVLYVQERVGEGGKRFRMYKFRTMRMDRRRERRTFPAPIAECATRLRLTRAIPGWVGSFADGVSTNCLSCGTWCWET